MLNVIKLEPIMYILTNWYMLLKQFLAIKGHNNTNKRLNTLKIMWHNMSYSDDHTVSQTCQDNKEKTVLQ